MKGRTITILRVLLLAVFLVATGAWGRQRMDYYQGGQDYSEARRQAGISLPAAADSGARTPEETPEETPEVTDPHMQALAGVDLAALREINGDVVGWIEIPGTEVSYPLLQGADNAYYLERTWKKEWNSVGSIYLDYTMSPELEDFNTLVYGHRMRDGSMFGSLKYYDDAGYWEEHPSIYIATDGCVRRYDIFAAFEPGVTEITFGLKITEQETKEDFISLGLERSAIDTGIEPTAADRFLTLSTCTGKGYSSRWVVQAVLAEEHPVGG